MTKANKYYKPDKALSDMSLAELTQLRSTWLQEAIDNDAIAACMKVGRELGQYVKVKNINPFWRWAHDEIIVDYTESEDSWITSRQRFGTDKIIIVSIGLIKWQRGVMMGDHNNRVLYYSAGDDLTDRSKNHVFVPGTWLAEILAVLPDADRAFERRMEEKNYGDRQKIESLLSTGMEA